MRASTSSLPSVRYASPLAAALDSHAAAADIWPKLPHVTVAEFLLHVLRLRGYMEQEEEEEEVVMEFTDSEPDE